MRWRVPSAVLGVVLFAGSVEGAETAAPLESTKQELRKLSGAQKSDSGPTATEGLRPSLPSIQTPGQDSIPLPPALDPEKLEKEKKRQKQDRKNWLVNGVEQLERKEREKEAGVFVSDEDKADVSNTRSADGGDPQYLLKLYDEQKKTEEAQKAEAKPRSSTTADPLAPFLQGWLGNSPVRGQFFDEFVRKPDGSAGAVGHSGPIRGDLGRNASLTPVQAAATPGSERSSAPNPYLTELNRPLQPEPSVGVPLSQSAINPVISVPPSGKPLLPSVDASTDLRPPERKPIPSPLADDKKYFPQMKKF